MFSKRPSTVRTIIAKRSSATTFQIRGRHRTNTSRSSQGTHRLLHDCPRLTTLRGEQQPQRRLLRGRTRKMRENRGPTNRDRLSQGHSHLRQLRPSERPDTNRGLRNRTQELPLRRLRVSPQQQEPMRQGLFPRRKWTRGPRFSLSQANITTPIE